MAKAKKVTEEKTVVLEDNKNVTTEPLVIGEVVETVAVVTEPQILGEVVDPYVQAYLRTQPAGSIATESGWVDKKTGELLVSIPRLLTKIGG